MHAKWIAGDKVAFGIGTSGPDSVLVIKTEVDEAHGSVSGYLSIDYVSKCLPDRLRSRLSDFNAVVVVDCNNQCGMAEIGLQGLDSVNWNADIRLMGAISA